MISTYTETTPGDALALSDLRCGESITVVCKRYKITPEHLASIYKSWLAQEIASIMGGTTRRERLMADIDLLACLIAKHRSAALDGDRAAANLIARLTRDKIELEKLLAQEAPPAVGDGAKYTSTRDQIMGEIAASQRRLAEYMEQGYDSPEMRALLRRNDEILVEMGQ